MSSCVLSLLSWFRAHKWHLSFLCEMRQECMGREGRIRSAYTDGKFHTGRGLHDLWSRGDCARRDFRPRGHADQRADHWAAGWSGQRWRHCDVCGRHHQDTSAVLARSREISDEKSREFKQLVAGVVVNLMYSSGKVECIGQNDGSQLQMCQICQNMPYQLHSSRR